MLKNKSLNTACRIGLLLCASAGLASSSHAQEGGRVPPLPEGDGKQLVTVVCSQCHGLRQTQILRDGQNGWQDVVNRMVLYGAQITPSEAATITHYLATQLGPGTGAMASGALPPQNALGNAKEISLPDGPGKDLISTRCVLCHNLERVVSSTRSKGDWEAIASNMTQRGLKASPDELQSMTAYLSSHFGK
jgi:cytochrome c5